MPQLIIILYILFFVICFITLIYLIFKRINDKENEDFEKRDN